MTRSVWLRNADLAVEIRPAKGADIASLVDVASGIDVLFQAPWGRHELAEVPITGDSQSDWLACYGGGWQQLVPNAGAAREVGGVRRGYHGEAAVVGWTLTSRDDRSASMRVDLLTAPLRLTRTARLDGPVLDVTDTITNTCAEPLPVMWVQHPSFGAPFVDEHCTLTSGARTVISDAVAPGNLLAPDVAAAPDSVPTVEGTHVDLRAVPGPASGRSAFACLTDFDSGWFAIDSPSAGFGLRVEWDASVLPHAWFWQECHASQGFPWHGRAYVVAVEPANVISGDPSRGCPLRGATPALGGEDTWTSRVRVARTDMS